MLQLAKFGLKVAMALARLAGLAVFLLAHFGLNWILNNLVYPADEMALARRFFEIIFLVAFALIYIKALWEMVEVFWKSPPVDKSQSGQQTNEQVIIDTNNFKKSRRIITPPNKQEPKEP